MTTKGESLLSAALRRLRPLTHAGIPGNATRSEERQFITANVVVVLSILVTVPDLWVFFSVPHPAAQYAGTAASIAVCVYALSFVLMASGYRGTGVFLFSYAVISLVGVNTIISGTRCGVQYYFVAVAVGAMFVWPRMYSGYRYLQGGLVFVLFLVVMTIAKADPIVGPPLPPEIVDSMLRAHIAGAYLAAFGIAAYSIYVAEHAEQALEIERHKSELLLLNILPSAIASRLKERPQVIADGFDQVTILFADVVGFTPLSERLSPAQVVDFLNQLFSRFDLLAEKYGLEKIKTIGDAYMVAGGIPVPRPDHAHAVADMALEMATVARDLRTPDGRPVQLRIGINTGPAIAGVIGIRKFSYDLWGDAVNTASRMESQGVPGLIQVTQQTRDVLRDDFEVEPRAVIEVKGKGPMQVYLLTARRNPAAR